MLYTNVILTFTAIKIPQDSFNLSKQLQQTMFRTLQNSIDSVDYCALHNVSYDHRVDNPEQYNYCIVPGKGYDVFLYAGIAIILSCLLSGKLSAVGVLLAGMAYQALVQYVNLGPLSNGAAIWLNMRPADIFFYAFLPPLLLDSSIRIDFFTFKKVMWQVLIFAVLVVMAMTAVLSPILLYGFGLVGAGWSWTHAVLYCTMIASTDAVAVSAILKQGGGPEQLSILMEGESLFNDASSIVLFELFLEMVVDPVKSNQPALQILGFIVQRVLYLGIGGVILGIIMGYITQKLFRLLQFKGDDGTLQVAFSLAGAYLAYYIGSGPLLGQYYVSGVIAVVVYGLYGSYSLKWDLETTRENENMFNNFWTALAQIVNSVVFFFSGASVFNFFVRSIESLETDKSREGLTYVLWQAPIIYIIMFVLRGLAILIFSPLLQALRQPISLPGVAFVTWAGLRGALCLIMAQTVVVTEFGNQNDTTNGIKAALALWTAGVAFLTLVINAPLISTMLHVTGLDQIELVKVRMRRRAKKALQEYTKVVLKDLQSDEEEIMRGVNWNYVEGVVDLSHDLHTFGALEHELKTEQQKIAMMRKMDKNPNWKKKTPSRFRSFKDVVTPTRGESLEPLLKHNSGEEDFCFHIGPGHLIQPDQYHQVIGVDGDLPNIGTVRLHAEDDKEQGDGPSQSEQNQTVEVDNQSGFIRVQQGQVIGIIGALEHTNSTAKSEVTEANQDQEDEPQLSNKLESYISSSLTPGREMNRSLKIPQKSRVPDRAASSANVLQRIVSEIGGRAGRGHSFYEMPPVLVESSAHQYWQGLMLGEQRVRLLAGMQRFIYAKRSEEGLISGRALRIVNQCFHEQMETPLEPINCWEVLQKEVTRMLFARIFSFLSFRTRSAAQTLEKCGFPLRWLYWILRSISRWCQDMLGSTMLLTMEVAIEYYLSLTHSPQAQLIGSGDNEALKQEIDTERAKVWKFILTREIEAPARFQAIQNFRAALSLLRRQNKFVLEQLFGSGMIDASERDLMIAPISERFRYFKYHGPQWVPPRLSQILASIPFLTATTSTVFQWFIRQGHLRQYSADEYILPSLGDQDKWKTYKSGIHIIVNGLARLKIPSAGRQWQEQYLGTGATIGLVHCICGESYLTHGVRALGNAMGRGPVAFTIPKSAITELEQKAREGDEDFRIVQLNLYRLAAYYVVDHNKAGIMQLAVHQLVQHHDNQNGQSNSKWKKVRSMMHAMTALHRKSNTRQASKNESQRVVDLAAESKEQRLKRDVTILEQTYDQFEDDFQDFQQAFGSTSKHHSLGYGGSSQRSEGPTSPLLGVSGEGIDDPFAIAQFQTNNENEELNQDLKLAAKSSAKLVFSDIKAGIIASDLFLVPAGEIIKQKSHIVLLRGVLVPIVIKNKAGKVLYKDGTKDMVCTAPRVLAWLSDKQEGTNEPHLKAGPQGASLIVCPIYNGKGYDNEEDNQVGIEFVNQQQSEINTNYINNDLYRTHSASILTPPQGNLGYERTS
eukprot:TRINITY_DN23409_c1_g1_i7.p1 TRINITY_DN23409_c1_g1~~TRINITY_DN23409_c1_g1_i7.p1  ORF type:complete len:1503 (-),score=153.99 TRINITY_DN23409_c1_g1_i7:350-4858(-)